MWRRGAAQAVADDDDVADPWTPEPSYDYQAEQGDDDGYAASATGAATDAPPASIVMRDLTSASTVGAVDGKEVPSIVKQHAEEARRAKAALLAEALVLLESKGFATAALPPESIMALATKLQAQEECSTREIEALQRYFETKAWGDVDFGTLEAKADVLERQVNLVAGDTYVVLRINAHQYPGSAHGITIESNLAPLRTFLTQAMYSTKLTPQEGFATLVAHVAALTLNSSQRALLEDHDSSGEEEDDYDLTMLAKEQQEACASAWLQLSGERIAFYARGLVVECDPELKLDAAHIAGDDDFEVIKAPFADATLEIERLQQKLSDSRMNYQHVCENLQAIEAKLRGVERQLEAGGAEDPRLQHLRWSYQAKLQTRRIEDRRWGIAIHNLERRLKRVMQAEQDQREYEEARTGALLDQARAKVERRVRRKNNKRLGPQQDTNDTEHQQERFLTKLAVAVDGEFDTFNFSSPQLRAVPVQIGLLKHVQRLDLTGCGLRTLPRLGEMRPTRMYLARNEFTVIPEALLYQEVADLKVLDMSHNRLKVLPPALGRLRNLEQFQFEYNVLTEVCDFAEMPRLEVIELTDNALSGIPASVASLSRLWRLRLRGNPMIDVPPEVYHQGLEALKVFLLEMNPQSLPVPRSELVTELNRALADPTAVDMLVIAHAGGVRLETPTLAALVQARLPALLQHVQRHSHAEANVDPDAAVVCVELPGEVSAAAFGALMRLMMCDVSRDEIASLDAGEQIELAALVERYGSPAMQEQLKAVERGRLIDPSRVLAYDLGRLGARIAEKQDAAVAGRVVRFAVGESGVAFEAHRELLCARSEYFAQMLRSGLAEARAATIELPAVEPDVFAAFLEYVYADSNAKMTPENVVALLFLATEYDCARLRAMAECTVGYNVEVDNVAQVLQVAHFLNSERLKKACLYFSARNSSAVMRTEGFAELQPSLQQEFRAKVDALAAIGVAK
jgi:hypothetical protein